MSYSILQAIGNTPLVQLQKIPSPGCAAIYVKLEYLNPTGSYKDRMALSIIEQAEKRGDLRPGMTVVENTGGSTGTSLAFICTVKGYPFKAVSSDAFAKEKLRAIQLFGGDLEIIPSDNGRINIDLHTKMLNRAKAIAEEEGAYWTRQFENRDALIGYRNIGKEILQQMPQHPAVFCAAIGTAGMATGTSQALKETDPAIRVVFLEPASAPIISTGQGGSHKVEGIGVGFLPPLLQEARYDEVRTIEESSARAMAKRLAAEEGIFAGTSTGLNVTAALQLGQELGPGHSIVTIAVDSGLKYLSGGLFDQ